MILAGISASFHLFNYAWSGVIRSPVSWHDRTPVSLCYRFNSRSALTRYRVGESSVVYPKVWRIHQADEQEADTSDVQMMDDRLASYWSEFLSECLAVLGTFALVAYTFPLLCLFFIPLILFFVSVPMNMKVRR
jgi:ATP-binding cassette subfamily C (CFTR/MRP) protein 1